MLRGEFYYIQPSTLWIISKKCEEEREKRNIPRKCSEELDREC